MALKRELVESLDWALAALQSYADEMGEMEDLEPEFDKARELVASERRRGK